LLTSTEAECTKELLYLKAIIEELTDSAVNAELRVDNQSAIQLIKFGQKRVS